MAFPLIFLIGLAIAGLLMLGALATIVLLMANPKTRVAGVVLLVIVIIAAALLGTAMFFQALRIDGANDEFLLEITNEPLLFVTEETPKTEEQPVAEVVSDADMALTTDDETEAPDAAAAVPEETSEATGEKTPVAAAERPLWVDAPSRRVGDAYQMSITVGPYTTRLECDAQRDDALHDAVQQYVEARIGPAAVDRVRLPEDYLSERLVVEQWEETIQASFGPMVQLHVLTQFDRDVQQRIDSAWKQAVITRRLWYLGIGLSGVLGFLAVLFAGMKIGLQHRSKEAMPNETAAGDTTPGRGRWRTMAAIGMASFAVVALAAFLRTTGGRVGLGPTELLLLAVLIGLTQLSVLIDKSWRSWGLGYVACFFVAVVLTPADPMSTLFVAVPLCVVYTLCWLLWRNPHNRAQPDSGSIAGRTPP